MKRGRGLYSKALVLACMQFAAGCSDGSESLGRNVPSDPADFPVSNRAKDLISRVQRHFEIETLRPELFGATRVITRVFETENDIRIHSVGDTLVPQLAPNADVAISLPASSAGAFSIQDVKSGMAAHVTLRGARSAEAENGGGALTYKGGHELGDLIVRPSAVGFEDYIVVEDGSATRIEYDVDLTAEVAGVRLVANVFELLTEEGDPRLRTAHPYVVDSNGEPRFAQLSVTGCQFDSDPRAPWGRPVTSPRSSSCRVSVTWDPDGLTAPLLVDPNWTGAGVMTIERYGHILSAPATNTGAFAGLVLAAGGAAPTFLLNSAELYNPTQGTWTVTQGMSVPRFAAVSMNWSQTASRTADRVLVAGGQTSFTLQISATAERYNFATGTWQPVPGSMTHERVYAAAANPDTNKVLVHGGLKFNGCPTGCALASSNIYNFSNNTWVPGPTSAHARAAHTLTKLTTALGPGQVMAAGGMSTLTSAMIGQCEKYSPATGVWTSAGTLSRPVSLHSATYCKPPNGGPGACAASYGVPAMSLFVMGGSTGSTGGVVNSVDSVQGYDEGSNSWTQVLPSTRVPRSMHGAIALMSGGEVKILVAGGQMSNTTTSHAELWPDSPDLNMAYSRRQFGITRLLNGAALVSGGYSSTGPIASAERLTP
jgi:hypothetical protein